jgi:hypothetical protein
MSLRFVRVMRFARCSYHPPKTSKKRASQRWGWINEHPFRKMEKKFPSKWSTSIR